MTTPQKRPIDVMHILTFAIGLLLAGFGAWLTMDSRVTRVETTMENAHLAEVPQRLATIEANQNQVLMLLRRPEDDVWRRK